MGFICTNQDHRLSRWFALPLEGAITCRPLKGASKNIIAFICTATCKQVL